MPKGFEGQIVVTSKIVDYLSSGLYESPAACLKELINNAYDADATNVEVFVKPDADRIIVADDGHGMDSADFVKNFSKISESFKREGHGKSKSTRPKIGKIGIGFIAANEICDIMQVVSTKKGSTERIDVEINFEAMRTPADQRKLGSDEFAKADFVGRVSTAEKAEHYTRIFLKKVRGPARDLLSGARSSGNPTSLYGLSPESIETRLAAGSLRSWDDLDFYSRTMLEIALNVPVAYAPHWASSRHVSSLRAFTAKAASLNFKVTLDGTELRKPTVLPPSDSSFVRTFTYEGDDVSFRSYFFVQHGVLKPNDINGALIRIRNSAVGLYDRSFFNFPTSTGTLFQRWISAEVWADDRLEEAMNIDRKTMRVTHESFVEMVAEFHKQLQSVLADAREGLYETPARESRQAKARKAVKRVRSTLRASGVSEAKIVEALDERFRSKGLLHKIDVSELLELVLKVASKVLDRSTLRKFASELLEAVKSR